jgi:hypothetical protein
MSLFGSGGSNESEMGSFVFGGNVRGLKQTEGRGFGRGEGDRGGREDVVGESGFALDEWKGEEGSVGSCDGGNGVGFSSRRGEGDREGSGVGSRQRRR